MNVWTEQKTDRLHELYVYVGLAQACPNDSEISQPWLGGFKLTF